MSYNYFYSTFVIASIPTKSLQLESQGDFGDGRIPQTTNNGTCSIPRIPQQGEIPCNSGGGEPLNLQPSETV